MVNSGVSLCNRCGSTTRKTFLGAKAYSASFVMQSAQARALGPLRFLVVQLRHRLTADRLGDCLLTIYIIPRRFPRGPEFLRMSVTRDIASTNIGSKA